MLPALLLAAATFWILTRDDDSLRPSSSGDDRDDPISSEDEDTMTGDPDDDPTMYNQIIALPNNPAKRYAVSYGKPNTSLQGVGADDLADAVSRAVPPQAKSDSTLWIITSYWANDATAVQAYSANLAGNARELPEPSSTGGRSAKMEKVEAPAPAEPAPAEPAPAEGFNPEPEKKAVVESVEVVEVEEVEPVSMVEANGLFNGQIKTRLGSSSRIGGGY